MTLLSVNLNKIALLRNARDGDSPSVVAAAEMCLEAGAGGITVHPRPDQRHTRPSDVAELAAVVLTEPTAELNVEGNPFPDFLDLVRAIRPTQCTRVPDEPDALTSDHGWDLHAHGERLHPIVRELQDLGIRVSLFMDPDPDEMSKAREVGADRVELYTESYARAHAIGDGRGELESHSTTARTAQGLGLGVNAGHDLSYRNLADFCRAVPDILEVSIGHALISHALEVGLRQSVEDHLDALSSAEAEYARHQL